jgi:hypothetical protein
MMLPATGRWHRHRRTGLADTDEKVAKTLTYQRRFSRSRPGELVNADGACVDEACNTVGGIRVRQLNERRPVPEYLQERDLSGAEPLASALRASGPADQPSCTGIPGHPARHSDHVIARDLRRQAQFKGSAKPCRTDAWTADDLFG